MRKRYGGIHALRGVDFQLSITGTVHALMGENGSGKSTLLSVLSGQVQPDEGTIRIDGKEVKIDSPPTALRHGIVMVSQETAVAPDLSVAENILMGRLSRGKAGIDWGAAHRRAAAILDQLGMQCRSTALVRGLRPDERQMVEVARALAMEPRVLILDEPTSSLTEDEVQAVLGAIRRLKRHDVATILVSHRLEEVLAVADEVTVLKDGERVAGGPCHEFTPDRLVCAMLGDSGASALTKAKPVRHARAGASSPVLELCAVSGPGFRDVSFSAHQGEIVGLAGLVGSGRGDVLRAVFGANRVAAGTMMVNGSDYRPRAPGDAIQAGIGYVPPERRTEGLVLSMTVRENIAMVATARARAGIRGSHFDGSSRYAELMDRLRVRRSALDAPVGALSGGNQQKIVLAKWLVSDPKVLLLGEPTRGVDVGSRAEMHQILSELAQGGLAVVVSSSENSELLELCDLIVGMFAGRTVAAFTRETVDEMQLTAVCNGHLASVSAGHDQRSEDR